jgi:hypothetical protein
MKPSRKAINQRLIARDYAYISGWIPKQQAVNAQALIDTHLPQVNAIKDAPRKEAHVPRKYGKGKTNAKETD